MHAAQRWGPGGDRACDTAPALAGVWDVPSMPGTVARLVFTENGQERRIRLRGDDLGWPLTSVVSILLFVVAALAEIGGAWLIWQA